MQGKKRRSPLQIAQLAAINANRTINKENEPEPSEHQEVWKLARATILSRQLKDKDEKLTNLEQSLNAATNNVNQLKATIRQKDEHVAGLEKELDAIDAIVKEKDAENHAFVQQLAGREDLLKKAKA